MHNAYQILGRTKYTLPDVKHTQTTQVGSFELSELLNTFANCTFEGNDKRNLKVTCMCYVYVLCESAAVYEQTWHLILIFLLPCNVRVILIEKS